MYLICLYWFLYIQAHLFLMCAFTGALILEDFGDLQSGLVANVMLNQWNSSVTTNVQNRVGLLFKAYTHLHTHRLKCPK